MATITEQRYRCYRSFTEDTVARIGEVGLVISEDLTIRRLYIFAMVAHAGGMRAASQELHMTQSAISQQLSKLEKALHVRLLDRDKEGCRPTSIGAQLLPRVQDLLERIERFTEFSQSLREGEAGVISIACYPVHIERFFARVIRDFAAQLPNVRLDLTRVRDDRRRDVGSSVFQDLTSGDVDVAMGPPNLDLGLDGFKAYDAKILLLLPDKHPGHLNAQISIETLRDTPILIAPPGFYSRKRVEAACNASGFSPRVAADSASPLALMALGHAGMGIPILPDDYPSVSMRGTRYPVLIDDKGAELSTPVWVQWRKGSAQPLSVQTFLATARIWAEREARDPYAAAVTPSA